MDKNIEKQAKSLVKNIESKMTLNKAGSREKLAEWLEVSARLEELLGKAIGNEVRLVHCGQKKINVIKTVREFTGLGLDDAKYMVESTPCMISRSSVIRGSLESFVEELKNQGATVERF